VQVGTTAAPDGLRGLARVGRWFQESAKIVRDARFRLRDRVLVAAATHDRPTCAAPLKLRPPQLGSLHPTGAR